MTSSAASAVEKIEMTLTQSALDLLSGSYDLASASDVCRIPA